jgi:hypothetical protein
MPWSIADTNYAPDAHPWDSLFNKGESNDVFKPSPGQQVLMDQATRISQPGSSDLIRATMTQPPMYAFERPVPVTIDTVLSGAALQPAQQTFSDFSGTTGSYEGSSTPSLPAF